MGYCICCSSYHFNQPFWRVWSNSRKSTYVHKKITGDFFLFIYWNLYVDSFFVLWVIQLLQVLICCLVFLRSKGSRRLPRWSWFLVSPHFERRLAFLNCRSRMANIRLHSRRIESNSLLNSNYSLFLCCCFITLVAFYISGCSFTI